jgi:hypothetical protein
MRNEKGQFFKGCKIDSEIVFRRNVTRKANGWHSEASKIHISEGQKKNLELIEKRKEIARRMGLEHGGKHVSEDMKIKCSAAGRKAWEDPEKMKMLYKADNRCRKGALACIKKYSELYNGFFFNTKPELEMSRCLNELGIYYIPQYTIKDIEHCYIADFYLPLYNVVLEVDGKWSHNYPDGLERDFIRTGEMENNGYRVIRFWECEFDSSKIWREI